VSTKCWEVHLGLTLTFRESLRLPIPLGFALGFGGRVARRLLVRIGERDECERIRLLERGRRDAERRRADSSIVR